MNLKPTLLATVLAVAGGAMAFVAPTAHAIQNPSKDGTITINGLVVANSCVVNANGAGSNNATVTLPTVYTTALNATGNKAGKTAFSVAVSGCDANLNNVSAYWSGSNIVPGDGNLKNTLATNNVEVQLLNADSSAINLAGAQGSQNSEIVNLAGQGATLNYYAQYYSTAPATPGKVNTSVDFTLVYQ